MNDELKDELKEIMKRFAELADNELRSYQAAQELCQRAIEEDLSTALILHVGEFLQIPLSLRYVEIFAAFIEFVNDSIEFLEGEQ